MRFTKNHARNEQVPQYILQCSLLPKVPNLQQPYSNPKRRQWSLPTYDKRHVSYLDGRWLWADLRQK